MHAPSKNIGRRIFLKHGRWIASIDLRVDLQMRRHNIRAAILRELATSQYNYNESGERGTYYEIEVSVSTEELVRNTGFGKKEIDAQIIFLLHQKEIKSVHDGPEVVWYMLTREGHDAYADDKYERIGRDERRSVFKEYVVSWVSIATCVIAILTLLKTCNVNNTSNVDRIESKIDSIQNALKQR